MGLSAYRNLWAHHAVRVPFVAAQFGRLPMTMCSLALVLRISGAAGYGRAGLAAGVMTVGSGAAAPVLGRVLDRIGRTPVLLATTAGYTVMLAALIAVPPRSLVVLPLCLAAGVVTPPLNSAARGLWRELLDGDALAAMYGADATTQEMAYIVGPSLVAVAATAFDPRAGLACAIAFALLGVVPFALARTVRTAGGRAEGHVRAGGLFGRLWRPLLAGSCLVASLSMMEVGVVASARHGGHAGVAGLLVAAWSAGSVVGGLLLGAWASRSGSRLPLLLGMAAAGFALDALPAGLVLLGVLLAIGGSAIAPTMAALQARVGAAAPGGRGGEAFSWLATAFLAGSSAGSAAGGAIAGASGPAVTFLAAGAVTAAAVPVLLASTLRGRVTAEPVPEAG
ncbi:MAG: MFS transporter [Mycobacteriales bacterium]